MLFNAKIVGTANAVAAGWGNMGAGLTHLIMPYILSGIEKSQPNFVAWRCAYFIPAWMQIFIGLAVLVFGQDLPDGEPSRMGWAAAAAAAVGPLPAPSHSDRLPAGRPGPQLLPHPSLTPPAPPPLRPAGNYSALRKAGKKDKAKTHMELLAAVKNYRTWVMVLTYGYCFGVELTVDNNISPYLYDQVGTGGGQGSRLLSSTTLDCSLELPVVVAAALFQGQAAPRPARLYLAVACASLPLPSPV